ncbi:Fe-S oxidoreductase [Thermococcus eurythermalis]|uniref:Fe-S oxidoreductase n=1 Tax=Thermococcus eurythermalis TaxID=1505907 RepID=A0A097QRZ8_9EURY|nr:SPASM domain-containing protein [Thermococcus eurythermalis]AIU69238.1 Fe-S oxidoreductase [Thermococcus eurythermalis]
MEKAVCAGSAGEVFQSQSVVSVAKPPWSNKTSNGKLERLILQLGAGKGKFSEVEGIPRSIGCIGNNRFILRREPLSIERMKEILLEFRKLGGKEVWLTNYDNVETLLALSVFASELEFPEVYAVVLFDDLDKVTPVEGVNFIAELSYPEHTLDELSAYPWLHGALIMVAPEDFRTGLLSGSFRGEVYVDVLFPGSARRLNFNVIELRRIYNPSAEKYHDCLSGTVAVTADGYVLPCPLLRNYVAGDLTRMTLKETLRKKRLRSFWRMTKDNIPTCATCPFKYICHDCRALEYQATGEIDGMEYCLISL